MVFFNDKKSCRRGIKHPNASNGITRNSLVLPLSQLKSIFQNGDFQRVIDDGERYIEKNSQNYELLLLLGRANLAMKNYSVAELNLQLAVNINSESPDIHNWIGVLNHRQGNFESAVQNYTRAISIDPKFVTALYNLGNALREQGLFAAAINIYNRVIILKQGHVDAYNNRGNAFKAQGDFEKAIVSYRKAIELQPNYAGVYYNLGNVLKRKGCLDEALINYQHAISLQPDFSEALHMLAAITGKKSASPPKGYVKRLFDHYAPNFDKDLQENLGYTAPRTLTNLALTNSEMQSLGSILDLGCGTGLVGEEVHKFCKHLEGVDLSNAMLQFAEKKAVYNRLVNSDILEYLNNEILDFDYFICADVFIYLGQLSDVFRLIKDKNRRKGKFLFSTEHIESGDFSLKSTGRYTHSKSYIESLCAKFDYTLVHFERVKLRKEHGNFLHGGLYLLDF